MRQTEGELLLYGSPIEGPGPDRGVVFQEPALFPWLRVRDNIKVALRTSGLSSAEINTRVDEVLAAVGLERRDHAYPYQLSGGMRHRVAVARAWAVPDAKVLLMDEPFTGLDIILQERLQRHLDNVWTHDPKTVVYITHSITEATYLADRVIVMTPSPGRMFAEFTIDLPRPRVRTSEEFVACQLQLEVALAAASRERRAS
jgi:NitT/TauT family transport system ATP-binding protein